MSQPGKSENDAVIKLAQYLTGLTVHQDAYREIGKALIGFFETDMVAFGTRNGAGRVTVDSWRFRNEADSHRWTAAIEELRGPAVVSSETGKAIIQSVGEVLETGFIASQRFAVPGGENQVEMVYLPISRESRVTAVMLVGHIKTKPLPKSLLSTYLAVSGLAGTVISRLSNEREVVKHRLHLEELVEARTAELTRTNTRLKLEIRERREAEKRVDHLNRVLRAISAVNQLIVRQKDRHLLLKSVCEILVEMRGYHNAWIALMLESGEITDLAKAGFQEKVFRPMARMLERGTKTACIRHCIDHGDVLVVQNPSKSCRDCPLSAGYSDRSGMTVRLEHSGQVFGLLAVSIPFEFTDNLEEKRLLKEIADDIAFALHNLEQDERRQNAETRLAQSEERFRLLFDTMNDGFALHEMIMDEQGKPVDYRFLLANPAFEQITGIKTADIIGKKLRDILPGTEQSWVDTYGKVVRTGKSIRFERYEQNLKKHFDVVAYCPKAGQFATIITDITGRKDMEDQLRQAHKMQAIGTLAGGIAHMFNNALTVIMGNIDLLKMEYETDDRLMETLEDMRASGRRMTEQTSLLLAYSEGGKYSVQTISLSTVVSGVLTLQKHTLHPDVRVVTEVPPDIYSVEGDPSQMRMILSALIANANEAMEGPGEIRISTRNVIIDETFIQNHPGLQPGPHVCLCVEDNGKGMDEETRQRIFEPFFTTNFMGRGLGMPAVYGIVRNHDGMITVDSRPGKGTSVKIYLPAGPIAMARETGLPVMEPRETESAMVSEPKIALTGDKQTILVIEDEERLLKMDRQMLERLGYEVLEAKNGEEAVKTAETFNGSIDLALLDIKLPDMSGNQVYPLIKKARPTLKVIVCSGYSIDGPAREILNAGAQAFIQKPFSIATLTEMLKQVLEDN